MATLRFDWSACLAGIGIAAGVLIMFIGIFYGLEEGSDLRTWDELRYAKRLFFAGAAVAVISPILAYLAGRFWKGRSKPAKPKGWDDLA